MNCLFDLIVVLSPNMGGKSTYMRQISSLVVLAQIVGTLLQAIKDYKNLGFSGSGFRNAAHPCRSYFLSNRCKRSTYCRYRVLIIAYVIFQN